MDSKFYVSFVSPKKNDTYMNIQASLQMMPYTTNCDSYYTNK